MIASEGFQVTGRLETVTSDGGLVIEFQHALDSGPEILILKLNDSKRSNEERQHFCEVVNPTHRGAGRLTTVAHMSQRRGCVDSYAPETAEWRKARSIEVALQGATYDQVAREVGCANRGTAHRVVMKALAERGTPLPEASWRSSIEVVLLQWASW